MDPDQDFIDAATSDAPQLPIDIPVAGPGVKSTASNIQQQEIPDYDPGTGNYSFDGQPAATGQQQNGADPNQDFIDAVYGKGSAEDPAATPETDSAMSAFNAMLAKPLAPVETAPPPSGLNKFFANPFQHPIGQIDPKRITWGAEAGRREQELRNLPVDPRGSTDPNKPVLTSPFPEQAAPSPAAGQAAGAAGAAAGEAKGIWDQVHAFAQKPSPQWMRPTEKFLVEQPLVPKEASPFYWMGKQAEFIAPYMPQGLKQATEVYGGLLQGGAEGIAGLTTAANAGLALATGGFGRVGTAVISGIFLGQAIKGTPEMWEALEKAPNLTEKVKIATVMGFSYLPALGLPFVRPAFHATVGGIGKRAGTVVDKLMGKIPDKWEGKTTVEEGQFVEAAQLRANELKAKDKLTTAEQAELNVIEDKLNTGDVEGLADAHGVTLTAIEGELGAKTTHGVEIKPGKEGGEGGAEEAGATAGKGGGPKPPGLDGGAQERLHIRDTEELRLETEPGKEEGKQETREIEVEQEKPEKKPTAPDEAPILEAEDLKTEVDKIEKPKKPAKEEPATDPLDDVAQDMFNVDYRELVKGRQKEVRDELKARQEKAKAGEPQPGQSVFDPKTGEWTTVEEKPAKAEAKGGFKVKRTKTGYDVVDSKGKTVESFDVSDTWPLETQRGRAREEAKLRNAGGEIAAATPEQDAMAKKVFGRGYLDLNPQQTEVIDTHLAKVKETGKPAAPKAEGPRTTTTILGEMTKINEALRSEKDPAKKQALRQQFARLDSEFDQLKAKEVKSERPTAAKELALLGELYDKFPDRSVSEIEPHFVKLRDEWRQTGKRPEVTEPPKPAAKEKLEKAEGSLTKKGKAKLEKLRKKEPPPTEEPPATAPQPAKPKPPTPKPRSGAEKLKLSKEVDKKNPDLTHVQRKRLWQKHLKAWEETGKRPEVEDKRPIQQDLFEEGKRIKKAAKSKGFDPPEVFKDAVEFGKGVFRNGMDFADWSRRMVKHLGERVRGHLTRIWNAIKASGAYSFATGRDFLDYAIKKPREGYSLAPETGNRYGLPDALRLQKRRALNSAEFMRAADSMGETPGEKMHEVESPVLPAGKRYPRGSGERDLGNAFALAKRLHQKYQFYRGPLDTRGFLGDQGTLFINIDAEYRRGGITQFIVAHEFVHNVRENQPALYEQFVHELQQYVRENPQTGLPAESMYWGRLQANKYLQKDWWHEHAADFVAETLANPTHFDYVMGRNPSFARKFLAVLRNSIDQLIRNLGLRKDIHASDTMKDLVGAKMLVTDMIEKAIPGEKAIAEGTARRPGDTAQAFVTEFTEKAAKIQDAIQNLIDKLNNFQASKTPPDRRSIVSVAIRNEKTGEILKPEDPTWTHTEVMLANKIKYFEKGYTDGYMTLEGEFLNRDQAWQRAQEVGQMRQQAYTPPEKQKLLSHQIGLPFGGDKQVFLSKTEKVAKGKAAKEIQAIDHAWGAAGEHLRPEQKENVKKAFAERIAGIFSEFDPKATMKDAMQGIYNKDWFQKFGSFMTDLHGSDTRRFGKLFGTFGANTAPLDNTIRSLDIWATWVERGRPRSIKAIDKILEDRIITEEGREAGRTASDMLAWRNNVRHVLSTKDPNKIVLSGPKVEPYSENLLGNLDRATLDRHMGIPYAIQRGIPLAEARKKGSDIFGRREKTMPGGRKIGIQASAGMAYEAHLRDVAQKMTEKRGEEWKAANVQESVWGKYQPLQILAREMKVTVDKLLNREIPYSRKRIKELREVIAPEKIIGHEKVQEQVGRVRAAREAETAKGTGAKGGGVKAKPKGGTPFSKVSPESERADLIRTAEGRGVVTPELRTTARKLRVRSEKEGGYRSAEIMGEAMDLGRRISGEGVTFKEWAGRMVQHLGEAIREHLRTIWDTITGKNVLSHVSGERGTPVPGWYKGEEATGERQPMASKVPETKQEKTMKAFYAEAKDKGFDPKNPDVYEFWRNHLEQLPERGETDAEFEARVPEMTVSQASYEVALENNRPTIAMMIKRAGLKRGVNFAPPEVTALKKIPYVRPSARSNELTIRTPLGKKGKMTESTFVGTPEKIAEMINYTMDNGGHIIAAPEGALQAAARLRKQGGPLPSEREGGAKTWDPATDEKPGVVDEGNGGMDEPPPPGSVNGPPESGGDPGIQLWKKAMTKVRDYWEDFWPRDRAMLEEDPAGGATLIMGAQHFLDKSRDNVLDALEHPGNKVMQDLKHEVDLIVDAEDVAVKRFKQMSAGVEEGGEGMHPQAAKEQAQMENPLKEVFRLMDEIAPLEDEAARNLGVDKPARINGPYLPRITNQIGEMIIKLTGETRGIIAQIRKTIGHFNETRVFDTMQDGMNKVDKDGKPDPVQYDHPYRAFFQRIKVGALLRAASDLVTELEDGGVIFRNKQAAMDASLDGKTGIKVEGLGGRDYWAKSRQQAVFIKHNFSNMTSKSAIWKFGQLTNQYVRNPNLINPLPHITKNMFFKQALAMWNNATFRKDLNEFATMAEPELIDLFGKLVGWPRSHMRIPQLEQEAMLGTWVPRKAEAGSWERRAQEAGLWAQKITTKGLSINQFSQKYIFQKADPAMRYAVWKSYLRKGMSPEEAAGHVWLDLVRYDANSGGLNLWRNIPLNFFAPWRTGTYVTLYKAFKAHPIRSLLFVGAIEYMREYIYRKTGKWTHLPTDYLTAPLAEIFESIGRQRGMMKYGKGGIGATKAVATDAVKIAGTMAVFGPGGAQGPESIAQLMNALFLHGTPAEEARIMNMFWGLTQIFNIPQDFWAYMKDKNPEHLVDIVTNAAFGTHDAIKYEPRRLSKWIPESWPGMQKPTDYKLYERLREKREESGRKAATTREGRHIVTRGFYQDRKAQQREDLFRGAGYLKGPSGWQLPQQPSPVPYRQ